MTAEKKLNLLKFNLLLKSIEVRRVQFGGPKIKIIVGWPKLNELK